MIEHGAGTMEDKIKSLFATIIRADEALISDTTTPRTLQHWDSLRHMFLISGFEEELGIEIEPEEVIEMYTDFSAFKRVILRKFT